MLLARCCGAPVAAACVQVKSIAEMGAYVSLLEYNGIEGMILLSELSRRRIRSITKLIKVRCVGWLLLLWAGRAVWWMQLVPAEQQHWAHTL